LIEEPVEIDSRVVVGRELVFEEEPEVEVVEALARQSERPEQKCRGSSAA
jgi:hypothetical protein